jgi:hypothetical protein
MLSKTVFRFRAAGWRCPRHEQELGLDWSSFRDEKNCCLFVRPNAAVGSVGG